MTPQLLASTHTEPCQVCACGAEDEQPLAHPTTAVPPEPCQANPGSHASRSPGLPGAGCSPHPIEARGRRGLLYPTLAHSTLHISLHEGPRLGSLELQTEAKPRIGGSQDWGQVRGQPSQPSPTAALQAKGARHRTTNLHHDGCIWGSQPRPLCIPCAPFAAPGRWRSHPGTPPRCPPKPRWSQGHPRRAQGLAAWLCCH